MRLPSKRDTPSATVPTLNVDIALINEIRHKKNLPQARFTRALSQRQSVSPSEAKRERRVCRRPSGLRQNVYQLAAVALAELHDAVGECEQRVVAATANVGSWMELRAALTYEN